MFIRYQLRRWLAKSMLPLLSLIGIFLFFLFIKSCSSVSLFGPPEPVTVVNEFYQYEQSGDFGSSWELFHSQMKERFPKQSYIQRRAHVFMQDFGVNSFQFETGSPETVSSWRMASQSPMFSEVVKIPVWLSFRSDFGDFRIKQNVFLAKEDSQYRMLWEYSQQK